MTPSLMILPLCAVVFALAALSVRIAIVAFESGRYTVFFACAWIVALALAVVLR